MRTPPEQREEFLDLMREADFRLSVRLTAGSICFSNNKAETRQGEHKGEALARDFASVIFCNWNEGTHLIPRKGSSQL